MTTTTFPSKGLSYQRKDGGPYGRVYVIEGHEYPSVTTILNVIAKPALVNWAAGLERELVLEAAAQIHDETRQSPRLSRVGYLTTLRRRLGTVREHQRVMDKALAVGSQAHALIERALRQQLGQARGKEPEVHPEALLAYMAFDDWRRDYHVEPIAIENVVYSEVHGYAGTLDLLARVNGKLAVVDFKTSKAVYPESWLQNVAYQQALVDMGHDAPEIGYVVRVTKDLDHPEYECVEIPPREVLWPVFRAAHRVWTWQMQVRTARESVSARSTNRRDGQP